MPPWVLIEVTIALLALYPALTWVRVRRQAAELRSAIENRLPRLLTAARMLLESGAATPERALTEAAAIHDDPAADVVREALRLREVRRLEIEDAVDEVAGRYRIAAMTKLADGFRVGRRYGTGMASLLAEHALDLRAYQHQLYRERITRAPVLMTVPALIFFVGPLLVLIMYLVFSPLFHTLSQL
jgi:Flp pilus assembly protein TadB